jgi:3-oxoacyl-[acyl-carrier protein] reductase
MEDKIALVTGSSRRIGQDIALRLADITAGVAVHYRSDRRAAEQVVREIRKKGKLRALFRADLTKEKEAQNLIKKVEDKFGKVDILVNNFGPILIKPWEKVSSSEWDYVLRGNLMSALWCLKAALPGMRKRKWGRVINLGYSRAEQLVAFSKITPYAIAKTGLLILTRTAAASEASSGITVNMVSPGLIEGGALPEAKNIPAGRLGRFEDISSAVLFLVSEEAGFITGTNLVVAGGWKI